MTTCNSRKTKNKATKKARKKTGKARTNLSAKLEPTKTRKKIIRPNAAAKKGVLPTPKTTTAKKKATKTDATITKASAGNKQKPKTMVRPSKRKKEDATA